MCIRDRCIAERTVKCHLEHIYRKLNINRRSGVAVALRQAQISCRDDGVFLLDLSKGDPPEINGVGAPERVQLLNGDQIRFGEVTFRLRLEVERDA